MLLILPKSGPGVGPGSCSALLPNGSRQLAHNTLVRGEAMGGGVGRGKKQVFRKKVGNVVDGELAFDAVGD